MMAAVGFINTEDRVFEIIPKRIKRTSDAVLTPEMKVIVTTNIHTSDPFYNGAEEIKEAYMRLYRFDYKKHVAVWMILNLKNWIRIYGESK